MALKEVESIVEKAKKANSLAVSKADVRKLSETKWQITGKSVDEIRALYENVDAIKERTTKMVETAHRELWGAIENKLCVDQKANLQLDSEHMKEGILYVIKRRKEESVGDLLRHILTD